ncbi:MULTISPECIES: GNAT family N-acetyltransferase [unclassified Roseitalea]|uniref:GNAT family N-acetyltransferase n=1 Tax=unclassified Roseitalea TaxID=2639107 RepID=UPI00273DD925|nr:MULTISPECIES: GNAT family N-acetyltransferase [unclassified Roseitalea]
MTTPPGHYPPLPSGVQTALLIARKPPLHFYRYLYFQVGIHWHWEARLRMRDDALRAAIHADACEITVLHVDGAPAGFFELNRKSRRLVDLAYFGMIPHVHGLGLGKWFLGQAVKAAWAKRPNSVTVNTCTLDHPAALPLYQKMGFRPYRRSTGHVRPLSEAERAALAADHGVASPGAA